MCSEKRGGQRCSADKLELLENVEQSCSIIATRTVITYQAGSVLQVRVGYERGRGTPGKRQIFTLDVWW